VEVGDKVTYCFADKPDERLEIRIIEGESNLDRKLTNENSPLAQALLNCAVGDESEMKLNGSPPRMIQILKVQRPEIESLSPEHLALPVEQPILTSQRRRVIGEKSPEYPFEYGFCQCGCGRVTQLILSKGIWERFINDHQVR